MPDIIRRAEVVWQGALADGSGTLSVGSGVLSSVPVSWPRRVGESEGTTSPEELIAAAHASCYAMALSHTLAEAGYSPVRLDVSAEVSFEPQAGGGYRVARSRLRVSGEVAGVDQARFEQFAREGEQACPVSNALRGNVEISVEAEHTSAA
jgi:osmotically inducible protein OsmC